MKKFNILLATIFVFFVSQNLVLAKSQCEVVLSSEKAFKITLIGAEQYFNGYNYGKKTNIKYSQEKMGNFIFASCKADKNIEIERTFANAADYNFDLKGISLTILSNKWWTVAEDVTDFSVCNPKRGAVLMFLWDNEGNEFWVINKKQAEELNLKINPNHLINSEWLLYAYGKPDILMNDKGNYFNIKGGFYDLDNKEKLEYFNSGITIKSGPNDGYFLVMKTLEYLKSDASGKKIKQDTSEWGEQNFIDCGINNIRGTKEFSIQFESIKSKWNKSQ